MMGEKRVSEICSWVENGTHCFCSKCSFIQIHRDKIIVDVRNWAAYEDDTHFWIWTILEGLFIGELISYLLSLPLNESIGSTGWLKCLAVDMLTASIWFALKYFRLRERIAWI